MFFLAFTLTSFTFLFISVESWLLYNRPYSCEENGSFSVFPGAMPRSERMEISPSHRVGRVNSRSTHTAAGATSPGLSR